MDLASSAISVEKREVERFAVRHEMVALILMVIRAGVAKRRMEGVGGRIGWLVAIARC